MKNPKTDLPQGTLDMLILKAVSLGRLHGYGILLRIQQISGDALQIPQGSIYPALYRLEAGGFIRTEWGESENNRRSKYYGLQLVTLLISAGASTWSPGMPRFFWSKKRPSWLASVGCPLAPATDRRNCVCPCLAR